MIKKSVKFILSTAFLLFIQFLSAQVTISIPVGNSHNTGLTYAQMRKPLGTFFGYERSALLFKHNEIGQYGQISSIAFFCDTSIHSPGNTPVVIYMKERTDSVFLSASDVASEEMGAQMVYSGTISNSSFVIGQWVVINFTTSFLHVSSRPVEVIIETNAGGTGNENTLSKSFYQNYTGLYNFQYWSADNTAPTNLGTRTVYRPNVELGLTALSACSGVPNAGITISSVDTTCSQVSLSLQGNTAASGLTYQWQDSTSGGAWTSISFANYDALNTNISADTWFRCKVTCSSQSSYSVVKEVVLRNYLKCYCSSNLGGGCGSGGAIDSVAIPTTQLVNGHTGCSTNNYIQYPALGNTCAQLASGQNYNLHTRFNGVVIASVWIDYDQNGQFDINEWKQICTNAKIDSDYVTILSVPVAAKTGLTLMRIRTRSSGNSNDSTEACVNFGSGETEDYFVGINYDVNVKQIAKNNIEKFLILYPNPASNTLYIDGNFAVNEQITYSLLSINGNQITESIHQHKSEIFALDISNYEAGIYFLKVSGKDFSIVKKVVIRR
jgi:hypothetical protein